MDRNRKSGKWIYYLVPALVLAIALVSIFLLLGRVDQKAIISKNSDDIIGKEEGSYDREAEKEKIKRVILGFYNAYQELNPKDIVTLVEEPLSYWEKQHSDTLRKQEGNKKQPPISSSDLNFSFKDSSANEAEVNVKRENVLEVPMPFKFGETAQGETSFKMRKEQDWKIVDRTYNSLWVSKVY